jgi:hypothetical protein
MSLLSRPDLILIYLQTQAVLTQSREVSLGRSMREWMGRMGISIGGETAAGLREQAKRITGEAMPAPRRAAEGMGGAEPPGATRSTASMARTASTGPSPR